MRKSDMARLATENRGRLLRDLLRSKLAWTLALRALGRGPLWTGLALAVAGGGYLLRRRVVA